MPRYVALLRGVSPMNCSMPELTTCLEAAGYGAVRTVLSSGNVAFDAPGTDIPALELAVEEAMMAGMGHSFPTIIRSSAYLQALVARDPFAGFELSPASKLVITFLRDAPAARDLPAERDGTRILRQDGSEVLTAYVPGPKDAAFMTLLERTFGKTITTRTLGTVERCARA